MAQRPPSFSVTVKTLDEKRVRVTYVREYAEPVPQDDVDRMQALVAQANEATRAKGSGDLMSLDVDGKASTIVFYGPFDLVILFVLSELIDLAEDRLAVYQAVNPHMPSISGVPEEGR